MTDWLAGVDGAHFLRSLYPERPPLTACTLHEITLEGAGGWAKIRFDVDHPPVQMPRKWVAQQANTAQITLLALAPAALSLVGWGVQPKATIRWTHDAGRWALELTYPEGHLRCTAAALSIEQVVGYHDGGA